MGKSSFLKQIARQWAVGKGEYADALKRERCEMVFYFPLRAVFSNAENAGKSSEKNREWFVNAIKKYLEVEIYGGSEQMFREDEFGIEAIFHNNARRCLFLIDDVHEFVPEHEQAGTPMVVQTYVYKLLMDMIADSGEKKKFLLASKPAVDSINAFRKSADIESGEPLKAATMLNITGRKPEDIGEFIVRILQQYREKSEAAEWGDEDILRFAKDISKSPFATHPLMLTGLCAYAREKGVEGPEDFLKHMTMSRLYGDTFLRRIRKIEEEKRLDRDSLYDIFQIGKNVRSSQGMDKEALRKIAGLFAAVYLVKDETGNITEKKYVVTGEDLKRVLGKWRLRWILIKNILRRESRTEEIAAAGETLIPVWLSANLGNLVIPIAFLALLPGLIFKTKKFNRRVEQEKDALTTLLRRLGFVIFSRESGVTFGAEFHKTARDFLLGYHLACCPIGGFSSFIKRCSYGNTWGEALRFYAGVSGDPELLPQSVDTVESDLKRWHFNEKFADSASHILQKVIENRHLELLQLMTENEHVDFDAHLPSGDTPLIYCLLKNAPEMAWLLLRQERGMHGTSRDGTTPLIAALFGDFIEIASYLIEQGVDVNAQQDDGWTALMLAAQNGHTDIVRLLIEKDTEVNAHRDDGWTALMSAAQNGHTDIVRLLIEKDAEVNAQQDDGWTALMSAASHGHTDLTRLLIEKDAEVNTTTQDGLLTALHAAIISNNAATVRLLLENGANPHLGENVTMQAHILRSPEIKKLLAEAIVGWIEEV